MQEVDEITKNAASQKLKELKHRTRSAVTTAEKKKSSESELSAEGERLKMLWLW